jgi:nitrite reductase/ring-hydroxylating ferredoxin subunit
MRLAGADGRVNAISSTCTHRGAQLANGWIDTINGQTCVRCPYHAWAFSGDGTVKHIPVQPEGGYPKRPLQQSFEVFIDDGKMWLFWGRPQIPREERPPVPGSRVSSTVRAYPINPLLALHGCLQTANQCCLLRKEVPPYKDFVSLQDGMLSTTVSSSLEAPHHNTMEVLMSEKSLKASARTLLGVMDCSIEVSEKIEETWASRTVTYTLMPTKTRLSPLFPQGLPEAITVTISAQLPSSVVTTFQLSQGRCLRLEAHVMPEKYETSRLTITAHHNFAAWAATGPFVRCEFITACLFSHCVMSAQTLQCLVQQRQCIAGTCC